MPTATSEASKTYSLWLMPPSGSGVAQRLRAEISTLQDQAAGAAFEPHVTLIGGLQASESAIVDAARSLAASLQVRHTP